MTTEWTVSIEPGRRWLWRCVQESDLVPGFELCFTDSESGRLVPLAESRIDAVRRNDLRHNCDGQATPVTPLKAN